MALAKPLASLGVRQQQAVRRLEQFLPRIELLGMLLLVRRLYWLRRLKCVERRVAERYFWGQSCSIASLAAEKRLTPTEATALAIPTKAKRRAQRMQPVRSQS